jgi:hypothetical protein
MTDLTYALDRSNYTWENALLWGNFLGHCKKAKEGSLKSRIVHVIIAIAEFFPILSQIASLFEKVIVSCFFYRKCSREKLNSKTGRQFIYEI